MQSELNLKPPTLTAAASVDHSEDSRRASFAVWAVIAGLAIGWSSSIFFLDKAIGLSFPLFILLLMAAALISTQRTGVTLTLRNLWLTTPALFFAAMVAIRAAPSITFINALMALGLGALWLHYLPLKQQPLDDSTIAEQSAAVVESALSTSVIPLRELAHARRWFHTRDSSKSRTIVAVGRGLLIAIPLLLTFAVLLSSADAIFSQTLEQIWAALGLQNAKGLVNQLLFTLIVGWFGCGVVAYAAVRTNFARPSTDALSADGEDASETADKPLDQQAARTRTRAKRRPILLSMIEAVVILGSVNLLFALFVVIQLGYFFGGQANVTIDGYTYAEYARRGFFELVIVAVMVLGLVLALDWVTIRSDKRQQWLFRGLALVMVVLTGIMMVSASQRMSLYETAYGYTHLRVYTHIFIRWLAVLFGFFVLTLFRLRERIFSLGVLLCIIGYGVSLNAINVEAYIAGHNVARYFEGQPLDAYYLNTFSVDAVEPMIALWVASSSRDDVHKLAGQWLRLRYDQLQSLRATTGSTIFSAHWGRDHALALLSTLDLPPRDNLRSD